MKPSKRLINLIETYEYMVELEKENKQLKDILCELDNWLKEQTYKPTYNSIVDETKKQEIQRCIYKLESLKKENLK